MNGPATGAGSAAAPDRYAVMGYPIAHSRSPWLHRLFAQQTGQRLQYDAIEVRAGQFAATVHAFFAGGGCGLNITVPHKQAAFALAASHSERARQAGAANTLLYVDGHIHADNTDGAGLVRDLRHNLGIDIAGRRLLLVGAGGAARGVIGPLLALAPAALRIVNRTPARALELAAQFAALGPVTGDAFATLPAQPCDLIINATAASLAGDLPPLDPRLIQPGTTTYDLAYGDRDTPFMTWSRQQGAARVHMGSGMLVEQAAEAFALWRGIRPDTAPALAAFAQTGPAPHR